MMLPLVDDVLALDVDDRALPLVKAWIPRNAIPDHDGASFPAHISVAVAGRPVHGEDGSSGSRDKPALTLDGVSLWLHDDRGVMQGRTPVLGAIDFQNQRADVRLPIGADDDSLRGEAYSMLTIATAMLLLHQGAALIHAGAVAAEDGAWLLVGDTHSGKSTTCLNLIRGGCAHLADDQVVLTQKRDVISVHGWPRDFHLDEGWRSGERAGRRSTIDPSDFTLRTMRVAPLAGSIMVRVDGESPSTVSRAAPTEALAALVRQAPWFLADRTRARRGFELLSRAASLPAYSLSAGSDVYTDADRLMRVLSGIIAPTPSSQTHR